MEEHYPTEFNFISMRRKKQMKCSIGLTMHSIFTGPIGEMAVNETSPEL
jgi:hypothetical protein